jgi:phage-related protein
MENKIPEIAKEKILDVSLMKEIWYNDIKPKINTIENIDESFNDYGYNILGQRDPKDIPFVALYFQLSSHGIITRDKDISSQHTIKTWVLSDVSKIITVLKKGVFCFYIQAAALPRALNVLFQMIFSILKTILELISTIVFFIIKIIKGVITTIAQLPSWVQIALGVIFLAAIFNESIRKAIIDVLNNTKESLINSFTTIYEWVKPILDTLVLIIGYALYTLVPIYIAFNDAINQIKQIEMEKAQYMIDN